MTNPTEATAAGQPAQVAPQPSASPYPTVQILHAAMAHRDSIRRSFESQRAALAEAIAAQKQAVTQAVVNAQRLPGVHEGPASPAGMAPARLDAQGGEVAGGRTPRGADPTEKLVIALSLLTVPNSMATQNAAAQRAMAFQQFLGALKMLIADEVSLALAQPRAGTDVALDEPSGGDGRTQKFVGGTPNNSARLP
jgi:hypothetical protein